MACKELKTAKITQVNQLFQLSNLVRTYDHGFYELSRMLMMHTYAKQHAELIQIRLQCVVIKLRVASLEYDKYK